MSLNRQPVHTLYGGANLFKSETVPRMGHLALSQLQSVAPDCFALAEALGLPEAADFPRTKKARMSLLKRLRRKTIAARTESPGAWFAFEVYERLLHKLRTEPVEDFRIDFEDGYGFRTGAEEDRDAMRSAAETAQAFADGTLPPFFGIRVKPLSSAHRDRSFRTLDLYMRELLRASSGRIPAGFAVTLPKVTTIAEVEHLSGRLGIIETDYGLRLGTIRIELMVEHPRVVMSDARGTYLSQLVQAGKGRVRGLHLGLYDYLSSLGIVGSQQGFRHPSADHLRAVTSVIGSSEHVWISDGAVNTIPIARHRESKLTPRMRAENDRAVRSAWREVFEHVGHSLMFGYYQGWDLHPSQLIPRYAAVFSLFLRDKDEATIRLSSFLQQSARARLVSQAFDDIATGLGLLQFFAKGYACGAFTEDDIAQTGCTVDEVMVGSFPKILGARLSSRGE